MKTLILLSIVFLGATAVAEDFESNESVFNDSDHSIHGAAGFTGGGFSIGGEWEMRRDSTYGVGAYLRLLAKDDDNGSAGVKAAGAFVRPHFQKRKWDFYITAGFGIHAVESTPGNSDESAIGAAFGTGLYYKYSDRMAFGLEQLALYGWFADDYRGLIEQHALAKIRWEL